MSDDESAASRERGTAIKRGRYVSNACLNCKKRKVKCSGEDTCQQCLINALECSYNTQSKRRRKTATQQQSNSERRSEPGRYPDMHPPAASATWSGPLAQMMQRISDLERHWQSLSMRLATPQDFERYLSPQSAATRHRQSSLASNEPVIPLDEGFCGPTNMLEPIRMLNKVVVGSDRGQERYEDGVPPEHQAANNWDWHNPATEQICGLDILDRESRIQDVTRLWHAVDIYFEMVNPMFPCLNENQFRQQLREAVGDEVCRMNRPDRYQFSALLHLIQAEVQLLTQEWRPSDPIPGWKSILCAERILSQLLWQGNGNLLTVQCLVVKTRYFLYLERGNAAHETITRAVRLCFQLGLHDSSSWGRCTPFERVMQQRVFWTVFQLERSLALNSGFPYLIRESEINVDLPACYDDCALFLDGPLPAEAPHRSYGPTLAAVAKWGSLVSEIWDVLFAAKGRKPTNPEYIASMQARIVFIMKNLPTYLQLNTGVATSVSASVHPPARFFTRHAEIINLRFNQLRLLLYQKTLLSFDYDEDIAKSCLSITKDTLQTVQSGLNAGNSVYFRFIACFHIVVTLIPLVCLIMHRRNSSETRDEAISSFKTELSILQDLAPSFGMARHVLQRLGALITSVKAATQDLITESAAPSASGNAPNVWSSTPRINPVSPATHFDDIAHLDIDSSMLDQLVGGEFVSDQPALLADVTSIWPDVPPGYQWTLSTGNT